MYLNAYTNQIYLQFKLCLQISLVCNIKVTNLVIRNYCENFFILFICETKSENTHFLTKFST